VNNNQQNKNCNANNNQQNKNCNANNNQQNKKLQREQQPTEQKLQREQQPTERKLQREQQLQREQPLSQTPSPVIELLSSPKVQKNYKKIMGKLQLIDKTNITENNMSEIINEALSENIDKKDIERIMIDNDIKIDSTNLILYDIEKENINKINTFIDNININELSIDEI
jgi:hypothetical protein